MWQSIQGRSAEVESFFRTFAVMLQEDSPWTPERAPESSSSSAVADTSSPAVAESEPCDTMSQVEEISSNSSTPKKARKGPYTSKRGQDKIQIATMPEYELVSPQAGRKSGRSDCFPRARTRCGCVSMTFLGSRDGSRTNFAVAECQCQRPTHWKRSKAIAAQTTFTSLGLQWRMGGNHP